MAERTDADFRHHLTVDASPPPVPKGMQGSDSFVPLSPQWLLPKPGDHKLGILTGDSQFTPPGNQQDTIKASENDELYVTEKRKDTFRPSVYNSESDRHDRWRDEERETDSAIRRDRFGDTRRNSSDRWTDSGNNHDQRRESKWNTRWGPDGKESENWRISHLTSHGKDIIDHGKEEREGDNHSRLWRSNSSLSRGRGDQSSTPIKQAPAFPYGRGRGENPPLIYPAGRGKVNTTAPRSYSSGDPSTIRYSRMKLLDIYRTTDIKNRRMPLEGFIEVPSFTITEQLEPLALSAPTTEELIILKGIDKGEIVNSGVPQYFKDGPVGRNLNDSATKHDKQGTEHESSYGDYNDEGSGNIVGDSLSNSESPSYEKHSYQHEPDTKVATVASAQSLRSYREDSVGVEDGPSAASRLDCIVKDEEMRQSLSSHQTLPWRSQSVGERFRGLSRDPQDFSDVGRLHLHKDVQTERKNNTNISTNFNRDESQRDSHPESRMDPRVRSQSSGIFDQQREGNFLPGGNSKKMQQYTSPEDLSLYYRDPQGFIQGPFSGSDLIAWYEAGYFGIDLPVRVSGAPVDAPFAALGDVMPHLRMKARPPPGFGVAKLNDTVFDNARTNFPEHEVMNNNHINRHEGASEAENRFLESLMSGKQGYNQSGYGGMPTGPGESGGDMNYLLAQRMSLERNRSLESIPNPLSYWPGRDAPLVGSRTDIPPQSPNPQHVDLLSLLQSATAKPPPPANPSIPVWSNFSDARSLSNAIHGGMDNKVNHMLPQTGFGGPQQMPQQQTQPSLSHLLHQPGDLSSLLSSEISKDPHLLNLLQQQYLMSDLQSQAPLPAQLSILDKLLLIKQQQQKQEQQQHLFLQQQHLLSQVLSGHQSYQHVADPSYGHHVGDFHQPHESLQINKQMSNLNMVDDRLSNILNSNPQVPQIVSGIVSSSAPSPPQLPHQMIGHTTHPNEISSIPNSDSVPVRVVTAMEKSTHEDFISNKTAAMEKSDPEFIRSSDLMSTVPEQIEDLKISIENIPEKCDIEPPPIKGVKVVEVENVKKASDKKSRRQKASKVQPKADSKTEGEHTYEAKSDVIVDAQDSRNVTLPVEPLESQQALHLSSIMSSNGLETVEGIVEPGPVENLAPDSERISSHRAWKPALGLKAKSLLEIQQEEQRSAQIERAASQAYSIGAPTSVTPTPWAGLVSSDQKTSKDIVHDLSSGQSENPLNSKSRKSQLHDLLAEEVLSKSNENISNTEAKSSVIMVAQNEISAVDDDDFVEAKDTKKNRKKSAKSKGAGIRAPSPPASIDLSAPQFSVEKGKSTTRQLHQEKDSLPAPPAGPSLGDFVPWKGEQVNSTPAPAWSVDSGKLQKPTSLRDILMEQEKKIVPVQQQQISIPVPAKVHPNNTNHGSGSSWKVPGSSPSKASSPILTKSTSTKNSLLTSTQSKSRVEDDLFWGPLDQSRKDTKQSGFPSLATKAASGKGISGAASNRQKPSSSRYSESAISSSPSTGLSLPKGRDTSSKLSEAMDFRDWCEGELIKLTGSNDTSFLEFCLKQPNLEAETLLKENLGPLDRNHEFIDKFLNYKDFLSSDVIETAFGPQISRRDARVGSGARAVPGSVSASNDADADAGGGGGKKKTKKGKKASPSILGFNVVSNRIMMGEIQSIED